MQLEAKEAEIAELQRQMQTKEVEVSAANENFSNPAEQLATKDAELIRASLSSKMKRNAKKHANE